ncbi:hypothetical protein [uncultured Winogradskyella sp.]|uniref:hypothetical protein n=1 Tax=uncultured Winogradskyella sp. TaxID=395353 RepID=UPI0026213A21|nr:hypothetical protein [uncultured Winogradskyella sp.]
MFLSLGFIVAVMFSVSAQSSQSGCPSNSTYISASCVSGCYSVYTNNGTIWDFIGKKPTTDQENAIRDDLNRRCSTFGGQASIDEPGNI